MKCCVITVIIIMVVAILFAMGAIAPEAQQRTTVPRIGFLGNQNSKDGAAMAESFRQGLRDHGWVEGKNVVIDYRWADGKLDRLPALANSLVESPVDVIVLAGTRAVGAARRATSTIPIVAAVMSDPVSAGHVASFARPGRNVTGLAVPFEELVGKQLQILMNTLPHVTRVAILAHRGSGGPSRQAIEIAAQRLQLRTRVVEVREAADLDGALQTAKTERSDAIHVLPSPFFNRHRKRLAELAIKHRLPAIYEVRDYVVAGGLMSYGPSFSHMYRRAATYVDRILRGASPADLPIEQPTRFELVINKTAANAIGLLLPPQLLLQADEIIDP